MGLMPSDKYPYSLTVDSKSKYALPPFGDTDNHHQPSSSPDPSAHKPFALATADKHTDYLFMSSPSTVCPIGFQTALQHKAAQTRELRHLWSPVSDELVALGFDPVSYAAKPEFDLSDICFVYYEVLAYKYYWGKLPDKISEDLFDRLHKLASIEFSNFFESDNYVRLFTHELSQDILTGFETASSTKQSKSKVLYRLLSGHDSTIFALQMAFNRTSHQCLVDKANGTQVSGECLGLPEFASSWLFELRRHNQSKQYFVKLLNDGKTVTGLCPSQSADNPYCSYSEFRTLITDNLQFKPNKRMDYLRYCGNPLLLESVQTKSPTKRMLSSFWSVDWWRHI